MLFHCYVFPRFILPLYRKESEISAALAAAALTAQPDQHRQRHDQQPLVISVAAVADEVESVAAVEASKGFGRS